MVWYVPSSGAVDVTWAPQLLPPWSQRPTVATGAVESWQAASEALDLLERSGDLKRKTGKRRRSSPPDWVGGSEEEAENLCEGKLGTC